MCLVMKRFSSVEWSLSLLFSLKLTREDSLSSDLGVNCCSARLSKRNNMKIKN